MVKLQDQTHSDQGLRGLMALHSWLHLQVLLSRGYQIAAAGPVSVVKYVDLILALLLQVCLCLHAPVCVISACMRALLILWLHVSACVCEREIVACMWVCIPWHDCVLPTCVSLRV